MSAKSNHIAVDASRDVGNQYHWASFMNAAALYDWACGGLSLDQVGASADHAICCFEYPLLLAARRGYMDKKAVKALIGKLMDFNFSASSFTTTWTKVWTDWPGYPFSGTYWRPRRGDLVFYRSDVGGDANHVVLSLGPNSKNAVEVVSFGEGLQDAQKTTVNKTTVDALRQQGHTAVKFVTPPWY